MTAHRRAAEVGAGAAGDRHLAPPGAASARARPVSARRVLAGTADPDDAVRARTRILDAATSLFAAQGFDGTSTARIAHAAGVPKGLLFYYFPTKPDILAALLAERLRVPEVAVASLAVPGDPARALLNVGEWILRNHAASDLLREIIWHESHIRPEVGAALTRYRRGLHDTIEHVLSASVSVPVDDDALRAAAAAWAATITARPLSGLGPDALHGAASLRTIAELLCQGLQAHPVDHP